MSICKILCHFDTIYVILGYVMWFYIVLNNFMSFNSLINKLIYKIIN